MSKKAKTSTSTPATTNGPELPMLCVFAAAPPAKDVLHDLTFSLTKKPPTIHVATEDVTYVSTVEKHANYAIGAYDPKTNSIKFSPISHVFKLNLEQKESAYSPVEADAKESGKVMRAEVALAGAFGSTRRQKMFEERDMYKLGTTDISQLPDISAEHSEQTNDIRKAKQDLYIDQMRLVLPKFDLKAKEAKDIFSISSVIPQDLLELIDATEIVEMIKKQATRNEAASKYPAFVVGFLESKECLKRKNFTQYAMYLSLMIHAYVHFYVTMKRGVKCPNTALDIAAAHGLYISEDVATSFITSYATKVESTRETTSNSNANVVSRFMLNSQSEDKLLFHILVMALWMHSFEPFNIAVLAASLKMELPKLSNYFRVLGCNIERPSADRVGDKRKRNNAAEPEDAQPASAETAEGASTSTPAPTVAPVKQYIVQLRAPLCLREVVVTRFVRK